MKQIQLTDLIQMPLLIGATELSHPQREVIHIKSLDYNLALNLNIFTTLKKFLLNPNKTQTLNCNYNFISPKSLQITNDQYQDLLSLNLQHRKFLLHKQNPHRPPIELQYQFSFQVFLSPQNNEKLKIKILQQNISFQLAKINSNIKFVKNDILNQLLTCPNESTLYLNKIKGLLTMDQSNRFLLQRLSMPFPVIGFWLKTQSDLQNIEVMQHFSQFIKAKYQKKCTFRRTQNDHDHFYFVRISQEKRVETFIVSWVVNEPSIKEYKINTSTNLIKLSSSTPCPKDAQFFPVKNNFNCLPTKLVPIPSQQQNSQSSSNQDQFLSSYQNSSSTSSVKSQQNGMNFTLRNYQNKNSPPTLQSLINYSYLSPIKQLQSTQKQNNLFSQTYQNSPQFSTLMKQQTQTNQCSELRAKVQSQEIQINKLKQIIIEMQSELKLYKNSRMSTHYESNKKISHFTGAISSPQSNLFSLASNPTSKNSSPQAVGRLRQSDLKSNSASWSGDWLKNSSNKKGLGWRYESEGGSKQGDSTKKEIPDFFDKESKLQKLQKQLPEIREEDIKQEEKDPWQYMELIED